MKKWYIVFTIMFINVFSAYAVETLNPIEVPPAVAIEFERHHIKPTSSAREVALVLPLEFSDANWGHKALVCADGGYDLNAYAGKEVILLSYNIGGYVSFQPLMVWAILDQEREKCICMFKTVRPGSGLVPGIFSVKE